MPGIKMKRRKAKENRAAIYARVSDQSQDAEDKGPPSLSRLTTWKPTANAGG